MGGVKKHLSQDTTHAHSETREDHTRKRRHAYLLKHVLGARVCVCVCVGKRACVCVCVFQLETHTNMTFNLE